MATSSLCFAWPPVMASRGCAESSACKAVARKSQVCTYWPCRCAPVAYVGLHLARQVAWFRADGYAADIRRLGLWALGVSGDRALVKTEFFEKGGHR